MIFWFNNKKLLTTAINWISRRERKREKKKKSLSFYMYKKIIQVIFGCFYNSQHTNSRSPSLSSPAPPRHGAAVSLTLSHHSFRISLSASLIWNIYFLSSVGISISLISNLYSLSPSAPLGFVHSLIPKPRGRTLNCEERYASILEYAFYFLLEVLVFSIKNKRRQLWKHFSSHKIASSIFFFWSISPVLLHGFTYFDAVSELYFVHFAIRICCLCDSMQVCSMCTCWFFRKEFIACI